MFPNDFESEFTFENSAVPMPEEPPFYVLLSGDWSGNSSKRDLDQRKPFEIDRDNFDEVLKKLNVRLDLNLSGSENNVLPLEFREFDDFHPDNLFRNVSLFSDLRDVRRRLATSDTFESAAAEVRSWFNSADENFVDETEIQSQLEDTPPIESNDLLDMILTQPAGSVAPVHRQTIDNSELGRFVSKIVSPYLVEIDETEQSKLIAAVDETISELMRTILHHPKFQSLESAWRGLYFLVRRLETDANLKIFILDISQNELGEDLKSADDLSDSFFYRQLYTQSYAVIAGNYTFSINVDDVSCLMRLGKLAGAFDAPFISHIKGNEDFNFSFSEDSNEWKLWNVLRGVPEAKYLGLSPMKVLARLPYGESTDSTENFSFEELNEQHNKKNLLWLNPCFAITLLLSQSYSLYGWELGNNLLHDIENLPVYVYTDGGETKIMPCGEILLTENMLEKLLEQGLVPLISFRNSSKIRLGRLQSISISDLILGGKWN